jgi:hypothetical protein
MVQNRLVWIGIVVSGLLAATAMAADTACQEAQEILGLSLLPVAKQKAGAVPGLVISEIAPLSEGARIGLLKGDVLEQVNSWQARSCQSYSRAVQDARHEHKALLLLVTRQGRRHTLAFEPEIWLRKEQEQQEREAVATLQTMLTAPLPPDLKDTVGQTGSQALTILHEVAALAVPTGQPDVYEQGVAKARARLAALDRASQGEAEKRVTAGAKVLLDYYLTAQEIRAYKQDFVRQARKDLRRGRDATFVSTAVPYFLKSPVPRWIDKYPFLRASVSESPSMLNFLERPGVWDPDKAVELLWEKAKDETDNFARWLQGETNERQSAVSAQQRKEQ